MLRTAPAPLRVTVTLPPLVVMSLAMVPEPLEVMVKAPPEVTTGPKAENVAPVKENTPPPVLTKLEPKETSPF